MESAFLRMGDVPSSVIFCSSCILMLPGICCIYFSNPFLISPRAPITTYTRIVVAFIPHILSTSISRSLSFESFSVTLTKWTHQWAGSFFLFVLYYNVWSVGLYLTICLYWHIPQDCNVVFFCYCLRLMLVPFLVCVYIHLFADVPVYVAALLCLCRPVLANSGHPATIWSIVSWNWPQILHIGSDLYHLLGSCCYSSWSWWPDRGQQW